MTTTVTFEDLAQMKKEILSQTAPASIVAEHQKNTKFRRGLDGNMTLERMFFGPQVIDDVAIDSGAVKADKLEANLVLSTSIIAGAASPADRLTMDATGLKAYGTVSGTPNTNTLSIGNNGNFTFGTGASQITYVASTGVLSVPAAVITSLTIADVGTGVIGGTYSTQAFGSARIELGQTFFRAYNSAGNRTVDISGSSGEIELSSDPVATSRLDLSADGIELWKSSTRQFYLAVGVTNAVTMLLTGPGVGEYIGMNPTDGLWLGASSFAGAATKFRVSPLGALEATSATISGAITATSGSLSSLTIAGTLTMGASGIIKTSATTTRVELDSTGMYGYNAGTARFQVLNNGSGFLGSSGTFSWTSGGTVTAGGFTIGSSTISGGVLTLNSNGSISTGNFAVSTSGVMSATSATLSGSITATSLTITGTASFSGGSLTLPSGGTITSSTLDLNSGTMANLTIDGTLTIGTGGSITNATGDTWDGNGITLVSAGTFGDAIKWVTSGVDKASIFTGATSLNLRYGSGTGAGMQVTTSQVALYTNGLGTGLVLDVTSGVYYTSAARDAYLIDSNGDMRAYRNVAPGNQTTRYLGDNGSHLKLGGMTTGGVNAAWSAGSPAGAAYFVIDINGVNYRVPIWGNS